MTDADVSQNERPYSDVLLDYCRSHSEESLYEASLLSARFSRDGFGPDEIVALHFDAVQDVASLYEFSTVDRLRIINDAHQFLLEVMIGYGAQYKEFLDLRLQAAVRRAEEAEHSEKEKLEILAMIAHELGNPITIALGNMQLAAKFLDARDLENVYTLVSESREALGRLATLTQQIVAASRGEDAALEMDLVDVCRVPQELQEWAEQTAGAKEISFSMNVPGRHLHVMGNEDALHSIVTNLISNAVRYTPKGGSVTVEVSKAPPDVCLAVVDTGIGMSAEDRAKAADKFYRGDEARRMAVGGLGMGLAITSGLISAHGGRLEIESELGKGSRFMAFFPAVEEGD